MSVLGASLVAMVVFMTIGNAARLALLIWHLSEMWTEAAGAPPVLVEARAAG